MEGQIAIPLHVSTDWPADGLEYLGKCPICGACGRQCLYTGLRDRLFDAPGYWTVYRCDGCGCGYLDPRPNEETVHLAYVNYQTHVADPEILPTDAGLAKRIRVAVRNGYLNRKYGYRLTPTVWWGYWAMYLLPPPLRLEWDHYARHLPRPEPTRSRLLDVGCGNGAFLARARQAGWHVQGLEFDPHAAELALARGIDVWIGKYNQAPFPPESFDAITSEQVIEHVHDPFNFVSYLVSWLRPGGRLWIGTPNFDSTVSRLYGADWRGLHPPQHLAVLNAKALLDLVRHCGLTGRVLKRGYYESYSIASSEALRRGQTGDEVESVRKRERRLSKRRAMLLLRVDVVFP